MSRLSTIPPVPEELKGLTASQRAVVNEIMADLAGSANYIRRAAEKWIELSEKVRDTVIEAAAPTWRPFLNRLTLVGEGHLHPLLYSSVGIASRWLGKLPLADQDRYLRERIPVVVQGASGRRDTRMIDIEDMSEAHREQVFKKTDDGTVLIRDKEMQIAFLDERQRRQERDEEQRLGDFTVIKRPGRWRVEKGKLYPDKGRVEAGFTLRDIKMMAKDLAIE